MDRRDSISDDIWDRVRERLLSADVLRVREVRRLLDGRGASLLPPCDERSGIAGANPARVGDMPISSNQSGLGVTFLFLLEAPAPTAFNPKKRCPFQFVPVIALATCERLR